MKDYVSLNNNVGFISDSSIIKKGRQRWLDILKDNADLVKRCAMMEVDGTKKRGHVCGPQKKLDRKKNIKNDVLSQEYAQVRNKQRRKVRRTDLVQRAKWLSKRRVLMCVCVFIATI